ncbi:MAG: hypothetical protein LJE70_19440 [Chromatiaceae bacterium]|jgi:hypothetical protein|nr:hypothetical protein [Chromatiaceae bacterium]
MSHLSPRERECLARIEGRESERLRSCDDMILRRLLALRLIEESVNVMVPLPLFRRSLHLTVAGRAALEQGE